MTSTRKLALRALYEIWQRGKKPKTVLEHLSGSLDQRERAFLMELTYGVLRFRDTLDWALREFLRKPSGLNIGTINNLRLAAYQLLFTRIAAWAAVHEAVELEKDRGKPGVVNAVLRNLLRNLEGIKNRIESMKTSGIVKHDALVTSHPLWLIERWSVRFGEKEAMELAEADNRIPPLTLRVNSLKASRQQIINELTRAGIDGDLTPYSPDGIKLKGFHIFREIFFLRGYVTVQDEAAQLVSYLLDPRPGERVLDACAAPGGKTTHIAQIMRDSGEIVAVDSDEKRSALLRENLANHGVTSVKVLTADIRSLEMGAVFDRVLLDAPCSALGVIRRNPDVKYRHKPADLQRFKKNQIALLRSAANSVRPGGLLVYSVCSTEPEEGEEVVREFLNDSEDFYIIDATFSFLKGFMKDGFFRTYPHRNDMDGFFGVRLCKKA